MFYQKTLREILCIEWAHCHDEADSHQLPITAAFWIIWVVSMEECSSLTQNMMHIHSLFHSSHFHATATQYMCSLNGIYCPHWLVQWSCHCSLMRNPSPLSLAARLYRCCANCSRYTNSGWTFSGQTSSSNTYFIGFFLLANKIPLNGHTIFYLYRHQLMK